tara:strand:+ start:187 stop:510 length:324 start_codon:yes stop_codon:yes gene_type:complete
MSGVYFIHTPELGEKSLFKIGWSKHILKRIKQLQTGNGYKLELYKSIESSDSNLETKTHQALAQYRVIGEWFKLSKDQVDVIVSIYNHIQETQDSHQSITDEDSDSE